MESETIWVRDFMTRLEVFFFIWTIWCFLFTDAGICKAGYNYPESCPRTFDPPEYTKCCRLGYEPNCCEERADNVCAGKSGSKKSGGDFDPAPDWYAIWCPQPGDPDTHTICSWNNGKPSCFSVVAFGAIFGGVFGGLFLIGMIILIVCCCLCKKGHLVCHKWYDDGRRKRYKFMTGSAFRRMQAQQAASQGQGQGQGQTFSEAYPAVNSTYPPVSNSYSYPPSQLATRQYGMSNMGYSDPPPSYTTYVDHKQTK